MRKIRMNALAISMLISMLLVSCNSKDKVKYKWITQIEGENHWACIFYQVTCEGYKDTLTVIGGVEDLYQALNIKCMDYETFGDFVATSIIRGRPISVDEETYREMLQGNCLVDWRKVKEMEGKYKTADSVAHYMLNYPLNKLWVADWNFIAGAYICWQDNLFLYMNFCDGGWGLYRSVGERFLLYEPN